MQNDLTFSGLTICNTSIGKSGYTVEITPADLNYVEHTKPGTSGRRLYVLGANQSDQTSLTISVTGVVFASNMANLSSLIDSVNALRTNPNKIIGTLSYGLLDGNGATERNMRLSSISFTKIRKAASGLVFCDFAATFNKWGAE